MNNNKRREQKMINAGAEIKAMRIQWLVEELDSVTTISEYEEMQKEIMRVGQLTDREVVSEWVTANADSEAEFLAEGLAS
jgi:hypothetical protein